MIIPPDLAKQVLEGSEHVYVAYKEEIHTLLVSPKENAWFQKLHGAMEFILKSKDLVGTKSIAIREILMDNELDETDKSLTCTVNHEQRFLKIELVN